MTSPCTRTTWLKAVNINGKKVTMEEDSRLSLYLTKTAKFLLRLSWAWDFKMIHIHLQVPPPTPSIASNVEDIHELFQACEMEMGDILKEAALLTAEGESKLRMWKWTETPVIDAQKRPKKWKDKKYKEVVYFSRFIRDELIGDEPDVYVDVGAGMGYLSSSLAAEGNKKVIAVEGNEGMKVVEEHGPVSHVKMRLTAAMREELGGFTNCSDKVCLVGLHACGSLTPNALRTFVEDERYSSLVFVPCCYHKVDAETDFPMSNCVIESCFPYSIYFLRLAAQRRDFVSQAGVANELVRVYCRALFDIQVSNEVQSFDEVFAAVVDENKKKEIVKIHSQRKGDLIEGMVRRLLIQSKIQRLTELFVLLDRVEYLQEAGVGGEVVNGVIPLEVSPRGEVIVCRRRK